MRTDRPETRRRRVLGATPLQNLVTDEGTDGRAASAAGRSGAAVPNLQRLSPVRVGEEPIEMHRLDLELEREAVARLNQAIALCLDKKEAGTRELLESLLEDEEDSIEWLEAQLFIVKDIGRERYLAEQTRS